ncbi:hypothetical protein TNCV_3143031 [Trichonephila clavipes]|nr:hypothetical protein TNCV_3143031 [Trichonephila clavipes]
MANGFRVKRLMATRDGPPCEGSEKTQSGTLIDQIKMPPELAAPSNSHTTPTGGRFTDPTVFYDSAPLHGGPSVELVIRQLRVRHVDH